MIRAIILAIHNILKIETYERRGRFLKFSLIIAK